ncbi:hypothetical protein O181_118012 [Austropuccinia psidii MF-1]|uniref:Uncharacterized protein n=1 Tax=Austropuccinia psidii MF-1 TaxID=1389203 RepID=A0A9Q3KEG5_9BASI|nr:hypothetical protein [Austropuccinia psidii MF-1]
MAEANQLQKDKGQLMTSKLINYVILKLIILFYLQKELTLPQEASVDIYKASQKAYNNALQHKEYQILADLWKNCMNSYLSVIIIPGPSQQLQVTQWMASIDGKEEHHAFNSIMEEKQPSTTQASAKNSPSSQKQQFQHEKAATSAKARHQPQNLTARATGSQ